jgi:hypothetical protein
VTQRETVTQLYRETEKFLTVQYFTKTVCPQAKGVVKRERETEAATAARLYGRVAELGGCNRSLSAFSLFQWADFPSVGSPCKF